MLSSQRTDNVTVTAINSFIAFNRIILFDNYIIAVKIWHD